MTNAIAIVVPDEHVARVRRLGEAAVWIDVTIVPDLDSAPGDRPILVIGDPEGPIDPRVTHVARAGMSDDHLQALLTAIATGSALAPPTAAATPQSPAEARLAKRAFSTSRRLAAATDLASTEERAVEALIEILDADRAQCLFVDIPSGALWSEIRQRADSDDRRAVAGMAGWSARTGLACAAVVAGDDPRYVGTIDDPDGDAGDQIMIQPILGADARVHAVLIAIRRARRPPLGADEAALLARLAAYAAPLLDQLASHVEGQQLLEEGGSERELFRSEAVEAADLQGWGDVIRVAPGWLSWGYWVMVALFLGGLAFLTFARVSTYSSGPAIVRSMARSVITSRISGNVSSIEVVAGDRVAANTVIARLDDVEQRSAFDRITHEFEAQLRNHMQDPGDASADGLLRSLRQELERARTALEERTIRTVTAGVVSEVRLRPGQHVEPGDITVSIVDGDAGLEVVALLPGEDRPQLSEGMELRLELEGYRYAYQSVRIDTLSSDVIAPTEARRVLGAEVAEGINLTGPVVVVRGRITGQEFRIDGRSYQYHDGMLGKAEVRIRSERAVYAIVPGLRRLGD